VRGARGRVGADRSLVGQGLGLVQEVAAAHRLSWRAGGRSGGDGPGCPP
jgi:hypothetical protein